MMEKTHFSDTESILYIALFVTSSKTPDMKKLLEKRAGKKSILECLRRKLLAQIKALPVENGIQSLD